MNIEDAYILNRRIYDELNGKNIYLTNYLTYFLPKKKSKIKAFEKIVNSNLDVEKFLIANNVFSKSFFPEYCLKYFNRCLKNYYLFNEVIINKRDKFFKVILEEYKKLKNNNILIDLNNYDLFMQNIVNMNILFVSILYPEIKNFLLSLTDEFVQTKLSYSNLNDYFRKVVKYNILLRYMKSYLDLKNKVSDIFVK